MRNYRQLVAWQVAFELVKATYLATAKFPREEMYGLTAQMRRAAVSIASNIAEGAGRTTQKDFSQFVTISRASLNELETQWLIALDLGYLPNEDINLEPIIERLYGLLNGLRNSLNAER